MKPFETVQHLFAGKKIYRPWEGEIEYLYVIDGVLKWSNGATVDWGEFLKRHFDDFEIKREKVELSTLKPNDRFIFDGELYVVSGHVQVPVQVVSDRFNESNLWEGSLIVEKV